MTKRRKLILGVTAVCAAGILGGGIVYLQTHKQPEALFQVEDHPVYEEEFCFQIDQIRLQQRQELAAKAGIPTEEFRWDLEINGKSGYEWAADKAMEQMVEIKVLQVTAKENGVVDVIDYPSLMEQMEQENKSREDTKQKNGVVFGLTEYSARNYYDYFNQNLDIQTERALEKNGVLTASEEESRAAYDADPDYFDQEPYENVADSAKNLVIDQKYRAYMEELTQKAEITVPDREKIRKVTEQALEA